MNTCGLLVRMHARPGKEQAVEDFLHSALPLIVDEPQTAAWFAVRFGRGEYGIFDVFPDEAARDAHLSGPVRSALEERSGQLFEAAPRIDKLDVLADKLPVVSSVPDTRGLLLTFKVKPGHESQMEDFLRFANDAVIDEHTTTAWFGLRMRNGEYGMFDVFPGNEELLLHLVGHAPRELAKHAFSLLSAMPEIEMLNVQAEKIGRAAHQIVRH